MRFCSVQSMVRVGFSIFCTCVEMALEVVDDARTFSKFSVRLGGT